MPVIWCHFVSPWNSGDDNSQQDTRNGQLIININSNNLLYVWLIIMQCICSSGRVRSSFRGPEWGNGAKIETSYVQVQTSGSYRLYPPLIPSLMHWQCTLFSGSDCCRLRGYKCAIWPAVETILTRNFRWKPYDVGWLITLLIRDVMRKNAWAMVSIPQSGSPISINCTRLGLLSVASYVSTSVQHGSKKYFQASLQTRPRKFVIPCCMNISHKNNFIWGLVKCL